MRRDLEPGELEALEWALELDRRAARSLVRDDVREAIEWGDLDTAGFIHGAQYRISDLHNERRDNARSGLVSVPTSGKRSAVQTPPLLSAHAAACREALGIFAPDPERSRLARLRMAVGFAARCQDVHERAAPDDEALMVTLTYAGTNDDWNPLHISDFLRHVRQWMKARGLPCRYVWVGELQARGVIHYHVALWVPEGTRLPMPDKPRVYTVNGVQREAPAWWPHGMTRIEVARAAVPYLLKYLSKDTSKTFGKFPRGARIYGVGGLDHAAKRARRWLRLPAFIQSHASIDDDWTRAKGGGWFDPALNHVPSEFCRVWAGDRYGLKRVETHPRGIDASGPFSWATGGFACETFRGCFDGDAESAGGSRVSRASPAASGNPPAALEPHSQSLNRSHA